MKNLVVAVMLITMATTASAKNWNLGALITCSVLTLGVCFAGSAWNGDTVNGDPISSKGDK